MTRNTSKIPCTRTIIKTLYIYIYNYFDFTWMIFISLIRVLFASIFSSILAVKHLGGSLAKSVKHLGGSLDKSVEHLWGSLAKSVEHLGGFLDKSVEHLGGSLDKSVEHLWGSLDTSVEHLGGFLAKSTRLVMAANESPSQA